jgi:ribosomal protein S18 acetylase RimI-like enzyme
MHIRRAIGEDAAAIVAVLKVVAAERVHSAIDEVWSVEDERHFIESLSAREAIHLAVDDAGAVVGLQIIDRWSPLGSMSHVGQLGTFVLPAYRGQGVGQKLWAATLSFARSAGYRKLAIQVRASNVVARGFYRGIGFVECGRLTRQVTIDGIDDDEVLMEMFLG